MNRITKLSISGVILLLLVVIVYPKAMYHPVEMDRISSPDSILQLRSYWHENPFYGFIGQPSTIHGFVIKANTGEVVKEINSPAKSGALGLAALKRQLGW